jgi:hypothetical protein
MATDGRRPAPEIRVEVKTVPGPRWLGWTAVLVMRLYWAATSLGHALINPIARRTVMIRQRRH